MSEIKWVKYCSLFYFCKNIYWRYCIFFNLKIRINYSYELIICRLSHHIYSFSEQFQELEIACCNHCTISTASSFHLISTTPRSSLNCLSLRPVIRLPYGLPKISRGSIPSTRNTSVLCAKSFVMLTTEFSSISEKPLGPHSLRSDTAQFPVYISQP